MRLSIMIVGLVLTTLVVMSSGFSRAAGKPNVLLILVDDLKPTLGCYGESAAKTPNIDRLAARGLRFDMAYCNQAVCAPSRFTLMLGSHSTSTGLYGLGSSLRANIPDAVTLPQHFAKHGYRTESLGKVFHIGHGNNGDPESFSVPHFHDKVIEYVDPASTEGGQLTREEAYFTNQQLGKIGSLPRGAVSEQPDVSDTAYADGRVAEETIKRLRAAKEHRAKDGTPFFIASGYARPHLPFSVPKKYWDLYDPARLPKPAIEVPPEGIPPVAWKTNSELANFSPVPNDGVVTGDLVTQLIHGYFASTSYVDAQIGKVLDELDRLQLTDNTIVVLWGDHGWHLGDHGLWTKHTNYEQANRIPLIIVAPGVTKAGSSTMQLAESVDVYPTLAELAGLPKPAGPQAIDGLSLVSVLRDPAVRVRDHAYHMFPRKILGRAIRTERYRLVEWNKAGAPAEEARLELYDYETDPNESKNLAGEKPEIVAQLRKTLAAYPIPVEQGKKPRQREAAAVEEKSQTSTAIVGERDSLLAALQRHDRAVFVKSGWIRDPYIVPGPDDWFYLTGTTPLPDEPREKTEPYNTGLGPNAIVGWKMRLWRSKNLVDWESLGEPYSLKDGIWWTARPEAFARAPESRWRLWAPEIHWTGDRWALVHTSPFPVNGANLSLSAGKDVAGPWTNPMGVAIDRRHDPALFKDDDGRWWMIWGATTIAPLKKDFSGFESSPVDIGPSGETAKMGHEGCLMMKIGGKYVLFGTGWSTAEPRKGSYNLYYADADKITGPYSERKFAGRFLGHGTPFRDRDGKWWCTAFYNGNVPPLSRDGIETRDIGSDAHTINQLGTTLVPMDIRTSESGEIIIRALDPAYASPGPDEKQKFAGFKAQPPAATSPN